MSDKDGQEYSNLPDLIDDLKPHDHLCLIYESREEWLATVVPFISSGLKKGEKCIYVVDANTAIQIKEVLKEAGLAVDDYESKGQLSILHERDTYTREGYFDPDLMIALLIEETKIALKEGYPALRVTGEMSWALRDYTGVDKVLEYEAKLNRDLFPEYPCVAICQYDRWKFDPEIIKGVVLTHPLLIRGGQIYHNFYYVEPDEYLNHKKSEREVQHWLNNLERERKAQESLRESEERFRVAQDMSPDGFTILRPVRNEKAEIIDFTWVYENQAIARINGTDPQEVIGKRLLDLFPDHSGTAIFEAYIDVANLGKPQIIENVYVGEIVSKPTWLRLVVVSMGGDIATLTQDITERKQTEEEIIKQDAMLQKIFDLLPVGLWFADEKGKLLRGNPEGVRIWGGEPHVGQSDYGVFKAWRLPSREEIAPDDWALAHSVNEGITVADELLEIEDFKGQKKIVLNYTAPVLDDKGKIQGAIVVNQDITELKKAEEALQESEKKYRQIADNISDVVWITDAELNTVYVSPSVEELIGESVDDHISRSLEERFPPEALNTLLQTFQEEMEKEKDPLCDKNRTRKIEIQHNKADGSIIWASMHISALRDSMGNITGFQGVTRDITERKQAEEALLQEKREKELIVNNLSEHVAYLDLEMNIVWANSEVIKRHNLSSKDFLGEKCYKAYHQLNEPCPDCQIIDVFKNGIPSGGIHKSPDGRYWQMAGKPILDNDGVMIGVLDTALDISELMLTEQALQESEARFHRMLKVIPDMVSVHDPDMNLMYSNWNGFAAVPPEKQILNTKCYKTYRGYDQICPDCQAVSVLESKEPFYGEFEISAGYWIDLRVIPLLASNGEVEFFVEWVRDISDLKKIEKELKDFNIELEEKVSERTTQLKAVNKELESFAYSISHDFRAPLRALDGFSASLQTKYDEHLDNEGRHYLDRIRNAAIYMSNLVDDLLDLSRITRRDFKQQQVDLSKLTSEIVVALKVAEPQRKARFKIASDLHVRGDAALLQSALQNLLENAWKFSSKEPQAEIEVGWTTVEGETVFFVRDNGVGFDMAYTKNLFGAFQRLHKVDEFPGTGIGLATVQRIINRHGGRIWAESKVGKGATFFFTLQASAPEEPTKASSKT
jgi:PAS domain S-box-containing protein